MINTLLNKCGFKTEKYVLKNTKKVQQNYKDKYFLFIVGCARDKFSTQYPYLLIEKKDIEKIKNTNPNILRDALLSLILNKDKRTVRLNSWEQKFIKNFFGKDVLDLLLSAYK